MKLLPLCLPCATIAWAGVKREAEPAAEADPVVETDPNLLAGHEPLSTLARECYSVPETTSVPRQVETPHKACHQEFDEIFDTIYTEPCEEVIITTRQNSKVVTTGVDARPPVTVAQGPPEPGAVGPPAGAVGSPVHHH